MSAFKSCQEVEAEAVRRLTPFIEARSGEPGQWGRFVLTDKGPLAKGIQETIGDVLLNQPGTGRLASVEIKAEQKHTGNLYLECWSNLNIHDRDSWEARGSNPGWAWKMYPTFLFYYFLDQDRLYVIRGYSLWKWMHGSTSSSGAAGGTRIHDFRKAQAGADQKNDTWGHLVPVDIIRKEVGLKEFRPLSLTAQARNPGNSNFAQPKPRPERSGV